MRLSAIILLLLASLAAAENNFAGDPNVVMWCTFESPDWWKDLSGNGNHLCWGMNRTATYLPSYSTADKQEGTGAADFEASNPSFLTIWDATLSDDFPGKYNAGNTTFSVVYWFKPEGFPYNYVTHIGKADQTTGMPWVVGQLAPGELWVYWNGDYSIGSAFATNEWTFVMVSFDDPNNSLKAVTWRGGTRRALSASPADALPNATQSFFLGGWPAYGRWMDGLMDDAAIFSRIIDEDDANDIRAGTFDWDSEPNLVAHWRFNGSGPDLVKDETGKNSFYPAIYTAADKKQGSGCIDIEASKAQTTCCPDGLLSSNFPSKNGQSNNVVTVCFWVKYETVSGYPLVSKTQAAGQYDWGAYCDPFNPNQFAVMRENTFIDSGRSASAEVWYHVGAVLDGVTDSRVIRIYDTSNSTTYTGTSSAAFNLINSASCFQIGYNNDASFCDGMIDELVVFKTALDNDTIDLIRQGAYGPTAAAARARVMRLIEN